MREPHKFPKALSGVMIFLLRKLNPFHHDKESYLSETIQYYLVALVFWHTSLSDLRFKPLYLSI